MREKTYRRYTEKEKKAGNARPEAAKPSELIPDGPYCTGCPFLTHKAMPAKQFADFEEEYCVPAGTKRTSMEWCAYLNAWLTIQDEVKDCFINDSDEPEPNK
jgi:hypothetical protein